MVLLLALRVVACGNAFSLRSNRTFVEASHPSRMGRIIGHYRWIGCVALCRDGGGGRITQRCALRPSGRCLRQRFLATLESHLGRSFSSFPRGQDNRALQMDWVCCFMKGWWWGKDYSALRASPFGSLPAATLSRYARIEPWSKLLILPAWVG